MLNVNKKWLLIILLIIFYGNAFGHRSYYWSSYYKQPNGCTRVTSYYMHVNGTVSSGICGVGEIDCPQSAKRHYVIIENGKTKSIEGQLEEKDRALIKLVQDFDLKYIVDKKLSISELDKIVEEKIKSIQNFYGAQKISIKRYPPRDISKSEMEEEFNKIKKELNAELQKIIEKEKIRE